MPHRSVNLAFLGCGAITRTHSRTLRRLGAGVQCFYASRQPAKAVATARQLEGAGVFDSYAAALVDNRIDTVLVATPPDTHLELTVAALEQGKNVIVEKPAFLRAADFIPVRGAAARSGRLVLVAENYCYKPLARVLRRIIASGVLGAARIDERRVDEDAPAGGAHRLPYRCLNDGLRFSTKARMPSFWSSSANVAWNSRRSNSRPSASELS